MSDTIVAAVCYADCNNAFVEAQKAGMSPALCDPSSAFSLDLSSCQACVAANDGATNSNSTAAISSEFAPFLEFCSAQPVESLASSSATVTPIPIPISETPVAPSLTTTTFTTSSSTVTETSTVFSSLPSPTTTFTSTISSSPSGSAYTTITSLHTASVGLFNGSVLTITLTDQITLFDSGLPTTTPAAPVKVSVVHHQSKAWIVGAVLGPILALIIAGYFLWMYRRRKSSPTELEATSAPYDDGKTPEKAQLHSDSIPPKKPQEMEGSFAPNSPHEIQGSQRGSVAELPAIEPVGTEMLS